MSRIRATALQAGRAHAPAFVLQEPLSFWGGLDVETGRIIDRWHPQHGHVLSGTVLVMRAGRGSSSGSSVLAEALRRGTGPAGIVLLARDAIVIVGAMIASELYGQSCPVVLAGTGNWPLITSAARLGIEAGETTATIDVHQDAG
jgi:predicted aconitase with swiveling domain